MRNPRECLGQYPQARANDLIDIEQKYTNFTSSMLDLAAVKVRYEDLSTKNDEHPLNALFLRLGVPLHSGSTDLPSGCSHQTSNIYDGPLQNETRAVFWSLGYKLGEHKTSNYMLIDQDAKH